MNKSAITDHVAKEIMS